MKKYFTFMLILMMGFTAYILVKRPASTFGLSLDMTKPKLLRRSRKNQSPPYFVYLSGDVLVSNQEETYGALNYVTLLEGDEIFTSSASRAIIKLGTDQLILLEPGTKLKVLDLPKRNKGLSQFKLIRGEVLVDYWKSTKPVGIKLNFDDGYLYGQDITLRARVADGKAYISNDRNELLLIHPKSEDKIDQGEGAIFSSNGIETGRFTWVDQYNWKEKLQLITKTGRGREAKLKPPGMDERVTKRRNQARPSRRNTASRKEKSSMTKGMTKVFEQIKDKATNFGQVGDKIKESAEAIESFKKKQKENQKIIDSL